MSSEKADITGVKFEKHRSISVSEVVETLFGGRVNSKPNSCSFVFNEKLAEV